MLNPETKRFVLPFLPQKSRERLSPEAELAAVYALAEFERVKGGGLIMKQPEEKMLFISRIGYPLWLFPMNDIIYIFDGFPKSSYTLNFSDVPTAKPFMEDLERNSNTREDYMAFLSNHNSYFQTPKKEKEIALKGLIVDPDFKQEFNLYRKEAMEMTTNIQYLAPIPPMLQQTTIFSMLTETANLQLLLKEDIQRLSEGLRLLNKTTGQYVTELDYAAQAVRDEANAKIKAREEIVNPIVAKLNGEYKQQIANVDRSCNEEIESLEKLKLKTHQSIETDEENLSYYEKQAKTQAEKNHQIYAKGWRKKSSQTKKELNGLRKELKRVEKNAKELNKQKVTKIQKLQIELEAQIKLARQPLLELETERDAKMLAFRQETEKLLQQEKPVADGLNDSIKLRQTINARFEILGDRQQPSKNPSLFYIPFYAACLQVGLAKRYLFLSPSALGNIGFSTKIKGAFGMTKIKELLISRFKTITSLIEGIQALAKQDSLLNNQIEDLGEKNNLLKSDSVRVNLSQGLIYLRNEGWLSQKEYEMLSNSFL
jgi:hypothetical protein